MRTAAHDNENRPWLRIERWGRWQGGQGEESVNMVSQLFSPVSIPHNLTLQLPSAPGARRNPRQHRRPISQSPLFHRSLPQQRSRTRSVCYAGPCQRGLRHGRRGTRPELSLPGSSPVSLPSPLDRAIEELHHGRIGEVTRVDRSTVCDVVDSGDLGVSEDVTRRASN
jgi:hypothetical protein